MESGIMEVDSGEWDAEVAVLDIPLIVCYFYFRRPALVDQHYHHPRIVVTHKQKGTGQVMHGRSLCRCWIPLELAWV